MQQLLTNIRIQQVTNSTVVARRVIIICVLIIISSCDTLDSKRTKMQPNKASFEVMRLSENPIITPDKNPGIGDNVNGPSLIKVPGWIPNPLGRYYLYFAHHNGKYIRLAYSQSLGGPYKVHGPGTLKLRQTVCIDHIASPDIYVDMKKLEIRMYFHCPVKDKSGQHTFYAVSKDGLNFTANQEILGKSYFRIFQHDGYFYALALGGALYRSRTGLTMFQEGKNPFAQNGETEIRHLAVKVNGSVLKVFYSRIGDKPERILISTIDMSVGWSRWRATSPVTILKPEKVYEGVDLPITASIGGAAQGRVRELRDPAIYHERDKTYLLYTVAGESGIAISEYKESKPNQ